MGISLGFMNMKKIIYGFVAVGMLLISAPAYAQTAPNTGTGSSGTSSNWSGYAAAGGNYTGVNGSWTIPAASPISGTKLSADAAWVGIGGLTTKDLIQAGTESEVQNGSVIYQAWYEALPAGQVQVPVTVHAGDKVTVSLNETSTNVWHLIFTNTTTGNAYQTDINYSSSQSSADWIEEMPVGQFGTTSSYVPLDMFGTIQFSNAYDTTNGNVQTLTSGGALPLTMMNTNRQALATPSSIGTDAESFSVARTNATVSSTEVSQVVQSSRGFRRGGEGVTSYTPGTRYVQHTQQVIMRQTQQIITRSGNTISVQFYLSR
ncbi:MAG: Peptidase family [Parcubacteria group bacterium]|nr:Peptidase family [Parcubacteria group bacterium]